MANLNTPFGFAVLRSGSMSTPAGQQGTIYSIPTGDATNAYYMGDGVKAVNSGDANGVSNITLITNGTDALRGAIVGIIPVYPQPSQVGANVALQLEYNYVPVTKAQAYYVLVNDDPATIWMMQGDATATNQVATSCNYNATYTQTAGATVDSSSASVLTSSSFTTTNTLNLKLLGLAQLPNNAFGAYAKWQLRINVHELTGSFAGV